MKRIISSILTVVMAVAFAAPGVNAQTAWNLGSDGNWQLRGGTVAYNDKGVVFHADKGNRCNPLTKTTHTVDKNTVIYYKVKPAKDALSIRDAKISIYIPDYTVNGEEGTLNIKQLRGYEVGKDNKGYTWVAFDLSKLGMDKKKQGTYTFEYQPKGGEKVQYTGKDSDLTTYNAILEDLKANEYAGNRFDFILISKLEGGNESFFLEELGTAPSVEAVKTKIK